MRLMKNKLFLAWGLAAAVLVFVPNLTFAETGKTDGAYVAQNSRFFEELEIRFLNIMNLARHDPIKFAETYLAGRAAKGGKYAELYRRMKKIRPVEPLRPSKALSRAARDHVREMYTTRIEDAGDNTGDARWARIGKYARWEGHVAVSKSYGYSDPDNVVVNLLLSAGDLSKCNILDPRNRLAGSRIGKNKKYRYMCVVYFAAHIEE